MVPVFIMLELSAIYKFPTKIIFLWLSFFNYERIGVLDDAQALI